MNLNAKLLNSDAELNKFFEISSLDIVLGTEVDLAIRLFDAQRDIRFVPAATSKLKIFLQTTDGELEKTMAIIDAADRSMWSVTLTEADTATLIGGTIRFELDESGIGSPIDKGLIFNAIRVLDLSC